MHSVLPRTHRHHREATTAPGPRQGRVVAIGSAPRARCRQGRVASVGRLPLLLGLLRTHRRCWERPRALSAISGGREEKGGRKREGGEGRGAPCRREREAGEGNGDIAGEREAREGSTMALMGIGRERIRAAEEDEK